jgi:predicted transcriptional regulator
MPENTPPAGGSSADTNMAEFRRLLAETARAAGAGTAISEREERLLRENFKMRDRLRKANEATEDAKKAGTPLKDGEVIVNKDDAKLLADFKALNIKVEDMPKIVTERDTLKQKDAERAGEVTVAEIAKELGVNPRAFARLVKAEGLEVSIVKQKVRNADNELVEESVPVVRKRGAAADVKPENLSEVLERDYADDIPLLLAAGSDGERRPSQSADDYTGSRIGGSRSQVQEETTPTGTRFPRMSNAQPTGASQLRKIEKEVVEKKAGTGTYGM